MTSWLPFGENRALLAPAGQGSVTGMVQPFVTTPRGSVPSMADTVTTAFDAIVLGIGQVSASRSFADQSDTPVQPWPGTLNVRSAAEFVAENMENTEASGALTLTGLPINSVESGDQKNKPRWVARYVEACEKSNHPIQYLANAHGLGASEVRDTIYQCRRRRFLTRSTRGRAGGQLTNLARQHLHEPTPEDLDGTHPGA